MAWQQTHERGIDGDAVASTTERLKASPPMFESRLLDFFSRVHPAVPAVIFLPAIAGTAIWGLSKVSVGTSVALFVIGYFIWTLFEYWLHRLVFHFEPEGGIGARLHWMIHGIHHDHPNDPMRLVMPPAVSVPLGALVFVVIYFAAGAKYAPGLAAGFFAGYLVYDMLHYWLHHHAPSSAIGRALRERHMRHHFQDDTRGYGISAPYWDEIFRTSPRARSDDRATRT
jgi:sterol desaturase/sphingolipid hydroxylase (fatty acid hydroxylase superfamily)